MPRRLRAGSGCAPLLAFLWALQALEPAAAHGPVEERLAALDAAIAKQPGDPELYLERAGLQRVLRNWPAALADLGRARELAAAPARIDFALGATLLDADRPAEALAPLARLLDAEPRHADGWALRGRALARLGRHPEAVEALSRAIAVQPEPGPALYLERADSQRSRGDLEGALRGLDEGVARLGPVVTLEQPAIDLELALRRFDAALARLDRVARQSQRQDHWLARRGEILAEAGRSQEAREALLAAQAAFEALPPGRQQTAAGRALAERIQRQLAALEQAPAQAGR